jgi:uncharacterized protein YndB with AHSA1/START domain
MNQQHFTTSFVVPQSPDQVFAAITDVRGWWGQGDATAVGGEFVYRHGDFHRSAQRVMELVPGRRIVWHVVEGHLSFVQNTTEWTDTDIVFDITSRDDGTHVRLTHVGLVPQVECFDTCSNGWAIYINGSLRSLITTGVGRPDPMDVAQGVASSAARP